MDIRMKGGRIVIDGREFSGSVTTVSGDVTCSSIAGNVKTVSGDIGK